VNGPPTDGQKAAGCILNILGGEDGRLQQASLNCTSATTATVSLDSTYLGSFQASFTGVNLTASCSSKVTEGAPCLITICSGAIILRNSSVSGVRGVANLGVCGS
jgi:hypothetical protein